MALRRRKQVAATDAVAETVQPALVPVSYRPVVADALRARQQFSALITGTARGPLRERLDILASDVDDGVLAVWNVVQHAIRIESVVAQLDPDRIRDELKRARRAAQTGEIGNEAVDVLSERFASTQRLLNSLDETRQRLPVLEARLGAAVASAAELVLTSPIGNAPDLGKIHDDLTRVTEELNALRAAANEV